jgi:hypothetical protein
MLYKSALMTTGSGKLKGIVASHNAGGQYFRGLTIPVNPNSSRQIAVRDAMSLLATAWGSTLTTAQRTAWQTYASGVTWLNSLGDAIKVSGMNAYQSCNIPRLQASVARVDAAPTIFERATLTVPVATITAASTTLSLAFTNTDAWANEVGGYLLVYAGPPLNPTINFFNGPFKFVGKVTGAASPPSSPASLTLPLPAGPTGSKMYFQVRASRADGRLSPPFQLTGTV